MSRIGKLPVEIPQGVKISVEKNEFTVTGPKGELKQDYKPEIKIIVKDNFAILSRKNELKATRAYHGLYRNLLRNMVIGVTKGFYKTLLINGVGYRAEVNGKTLTLNLGYSNPIEFEINDDITITCDGTTKVIVSGIDKQRVGHVGAEIRSLRPPEPYKGKGVKYEDEYIKRKIGKSGVK